MLRQRWLRPEMTTGFAPATATPQLCFGTVRHSRLRPVSNLFSYGVYFLRVPLRTLDTRDLGGRFF